MATRTPATCPRVDPETMQGLVTDVCLKRKVRNWVDATRGGDPRCKIFVENRGYLVDHKKRAYEAVQRQEGRRRQAGRSPDVDVPELLRRADVRRRAGGQEGRGLQLRPGPRAGAIDLRPLHRPRCAPGPLDHPRGPGEPRRQARRGATTKRPSTGTMGRKALLPYGLYRGYGFFTPHFAQKTGVTAEDLELFWEALQQMWTIDRSAARGMMALRALYVFSHDTSVGRAPAQSLFERIQVSCKPEVKAPRAFGDYCVTVSEAPLPEGVTLTRDRSGLKGTARWTSPPGRDEDYVPISALEHWRYCPRQCA